MKSFLLSFIFLISWQASAQQSCRSVFSPGFENAKGVKLVYEVSGAHDGDTVVLFLNGIDKDMSQWSEIRKDLASKHQEWTFVQLDLLRQGETAKLNQDNRNETPFSEQIEILKDLIGAKGWQNKKLVLVGHSYGAGVAARFASENPKWVKQVVMLAPFVDYLETHQPVVGPWLSWVKMWSQAWGMKSLYDFNVESHSNWGMIANWMVYSHWHGSKGSLSDTLALTAGIRHLGMSNSIQKAKGTRFSLITATMDELIPVTGHLELWGHVPAQRRGNFVQLPTTHEMTQLSVRAVTKSIEDAVLLTSGSR